MSTPAARNMSGYVYQDEASFDAPRVRRTAKNVANEALEGLERDTDEFATGQAQREAARIRVQNRAAMKLREQRRDLEAKAEEAAQARREKRDLNLKALQDAKRARQEARESKDRIEEGIRGEAAAARPQSRTLEIRNKSVATTVEGRREWKTQERPALVHPSEQDPVAAAALAESSPKADGAMAFRFARSNVRSTGELAHAANSRHLFHAVDSSGTAEPRRTTACQASINRGAPGTSGQNETKVYHTASGRKIDVQVSREAPLHNSLASHVPQKGPVGVQAGMWSNDVDLSDQLSGVGGPKLTKWSTFQSHGDHIPHADGVNGTAAKATVTKSNTMILQPVTATTAAVPGPRSASKAPITSSSPIATSVPADKKIEKNADTAHMNPDNGKKPAGPKITKEKAIEIAHRLKSIDNVSATAQEAEADDDFALVSRKCPSANNGSRLPDPNVLMDELDEEFNSSLAGLKGWDDDEESDDGEEWDMGGLTEWKWIGEKSAAAASQTVGA